MKSLETLIRLQKQRVDEQRLILARMHEYLALINKQITEEQEQQEQQKTLLHKDSSLGFTYGEYLKKSMKILESLEKRKKSAEYAVHTAYEKLTELFEEQKRYEIAEENRIEVEEREEHHRETLILDEVGSISFVRNKKVKNKR